MQTAKQSDRETATGLGAVVLSGLVCFCAGALYGWSALIAPLQDRFGVSTGQTGLVFSCALVCFTLAVAATPMLPVVTARARMVAVYGAMGAVCLVGASQAASYTQFLFWFSGGFGLASGGVYISAIGVAGQMRRHGVATPAIVAAFGLGGAVFGPLWRQLDAHDWGLSALIPLAVALGITSIFAAFAPAPVAVQELAKPAPTRLSDGQSGRMMRLIWLIFALGSFSGLMVLGLGAKMMDAAGADATLASLGLAGIAIGNTGGRLSVAWLAARLRFRKILFFAMGLTLVGLAFGLIRPSAGAVCFGLFCIAAGYGIIASTVPVLTRDTFGPVQFQPRFALIFTAWGVAGFIAPWAGGMLFDVGQSFTAPLLCAVCVALFYCFICARLRHTV